jgi:hypothetical protein
MVGIGKGVLDHDEIVDWVAQLVMSIGAFRKVITNTPLYLSLPSNPLAF